MCVTCCECCGFTLTTLFDTLRGRANNRAMAEFKFKFLAGTLIFEFLCETIPQLVIQGINNDLRSSWNVFTITSFVSVAHPCTVHCAAPMVCFTCTLSCGRNRTVSVLVQLCSAARFANTSMYR